MPGMERFRKIILIAVCFNVACAHEGSKKNQPMADETKGAVVYVYRPNSFSNVVVSPMLIIDGQEKSPIRNNSYMFINLLPGEHLIELGLENFYQGNYQRKLTIKPDGKYFVRVDTATKFVEGQPYTRRFDLNVVTEEVGLKELAACRYTGPGTPRDNVKVKQQEGVAPRFTTDKTSDPFSRNAQPGH